MWSELYTSRLPAVIPAARRQLRAFTEYQTPSISEYPFASTRLQTPTYNLTLCPWYPIRTQIISSTMTTPLTIPKRKPREHHTNPHLPSQTSPTSSLSSSSSTQSRTPPSRFTPSSPSSYRGNEERGARPLQERRVSLLSESRPLGCCHFPMESCI